jgi:hypothetical protein
MKPLLQRTAVGHVTEILPPIVREVLSSPGQPMDLATRAFMEPRFGHDFGQVRVHAEAKAAKSAQAIGALAYTVGHDVVFSSGRYAPMSDIGRGLMAHELVHVIQQEKAHSIGNINRNPAAEIEARTISDHINNDKGRITVQGWSSLPVLQAEDDPEASTGVTTPPTAATSMVVKSKPLGLSSSAGKRRFWTLLSMRSAVRNASGATKAIWEKRWTQQLERYALSSRRAAIEMHIDEQLSTLSRGDVGLLESYAKHGRAGKALPGFDAGHISGEMMGSSGVVTLPTHGINDILNLKCESSDMNRFRGGKIEGPLTRRYKMLTRAGLSPKEARTKSIQEVTGKAEESELKTPKSTPKPPDLSKINIQKKATAKFQNIEQIHVKSRVPRPELEEPVKVPPDRGTFGRIFKSGAAWQIAVDAAKLIISSLNNLANRHRIERDLNEIKSVIDVTLERFKYNGVAIAILFTQDDERLHAPENRGSLPTFYNHLSYHMGRTPEEAENRFWISRRGLRYALENEYEIIHFVWIPPLMSKEKSITWMRMQRYGKTRY